MRIYLFLKAEMLAEIIAAVESLVTLISREQYDALPDETKRVWSRNGVDGIYKAIEKEAERIKSPVYFELAQKFAESHDYAFHDNYQRFERLRHEWWKENRDRA